MRNVGVAARSWLSSTPAAPLAWAPGKRALDLLYIHCGNHVRTKSGDRRESGETCISTSTRSGPREPTRLPCDRGNDKSKTNSPRRQRSRMARASSIKGPGFNTRRMHNLFFLHLFFSASFSLLSLAGKTAGLAAYDLAGRSRSVLGSEIGIGHIAPTHDGKAIN